MFSSVIYNFESFFRLAEEKKEEGNQFYKQKQYREALSKYTEAIGKILFNYNATLLLRSKLSRELG